MGLVTSLLLKSAQTITIFIQLPFKKMKIISGTMIQLQQQQNKKPLVNN